METLIKPVFDEPYFIAKFESIPDQKWCTHHLEWHGCHCALGHCGVVENLTNKDWEFTEEGLQLGLLVFDKVQAVGFKTLNVPAINDGEHLAIKLGKTPKERILNVLKSTPEELKLLLSEQPLIIMQNIIYDEAYFIQKFEAIPAYKWITHTYEEDGRCCALGHCGVNNMVNDTTEAIALINLFKQKLTIELNYPASVPAVNDGDKIRCYVLFKEADLDFFEDFNTLKTGVDYIDFDRLGETPKERILKFLKSTPEELKAMLTDESTT